MDRSIIIFVKDLNGLPLNGASVEFFSGQNVLGQATSTGGRASIQIQDATMEITVRVSYGGVNKEAKLSQNQDSFTFVYPVRTATSFWTRNLPAMIGMVLLVISLSLAFTVSHPTDLQKQLILITMSLGAGGLASVIPGFMNVNLNLGQKLVLSAAGALAVFVIVFFNPPATLDGQKDDPSEKAVVSPTAE